MSTAMSEEHRLLRKLMARQDLSRAETAELVSTQLREDAGGWRLLAFSVAAQTKGETLDELLGILDGMGRLTGPYPIRFPEELMDISSSGGTGIRKINVSTLSTLVVGEPGLAIAKQSFYGINSLAGSADVLRAVGIDVPALTLPRFERALATIGVAFQSPLFLCPELENLTRFGQGLGVNAVGASTPYHLMVPLFAPFKLKYRMFGINRIQQLDLFARLFRALGYHSALAVHGLDGLDEVSLCGPSRLRGFRGDEEIDVTLTPEQAGLETVPPAAVAPRDAASNAHDFLRIVHGVETGPKRDLVALNSGVALYLTGRAATIAAGVAAAIERLANGGVARKLEALADQVGAPDTLRRATAAALSR
jgi:anthranilate phosphoribosyltransferase